MLILANILVLIQGKLKIVKRMFLLWRFVPQDVLSPGKLCLWVVMTLGSFVPLVAFCPSGHFVPGKSCPLEVILEDVLSLGTFCPCIVYDGDVYDGAYMTSYILSSCNLIWPELRNILTYITSPQNVLDLYLVYHLRRINTVFTVFSFKKSEQTPAFNGFFVYLALHNIIISFWPNFYIPFCSCFCF